MACEEEEVAGEGGRRGEGVQDKEELLPVRRRR